MTNDKTIKPNSNSTKKIERVSIHRHMWDTSRLLFKKSRSLYVIVKRILLLYAI